TSFVHDQDRARLVVDASPVVCSRVPGDGASGDRDAVRPYRGALTEDAATRRGRVVLDGARQQRDHAAVVEDASAEIRAAVSGYVDRAQRHPAARKDADAAAHSGDEGAERPAVAV